MLETLSTRRILFVSPILSFPPKGGPEVRVWNTLKGLALKEENFVTVAYISWRFSQPAVEQALRELFGPNFGGLFSLADSFGNRFNKKRFHQGFLPRFFSKARVVFRPFFVSALARKTRSPVTWFSYGCVASITVWVFRILNPRALIVYDTDSWVRFLSRTADFVSTPWRYFYRLRSIIKLMEEAISVGLSDATVTVSEKDAQPYRAMKKAGDKVFVLSNVVDHFGLKTRVNASSSLGAATNFNILLTGSFGFRHSPMNHGTSWFLEEVWPRLKDLEPKARLVILGKGADVSWSRLSSEDIRVIGEGDNYAEHFSGAAVSIVPLWFEVGTRIKILQSALVGVPVVSTTLGAEGLDLVHEQEILIADTPEDFAKCVAVVLNNRPLAKRLADSLRSKVMRGYLIENAGRQAEIVLRHILGDEPA